jgi:hypothetical protein
MLQIAARRIPGGAFIVSLTEKTMGLAEHAGASG